jgi:superfamily II DNA or RNA helicase
MVLYTIINNRRMESTNGYIYIRNHPSYDEDNGCKLGKANNIPERDTQYATSEIRRGSFEMVIEMSKEAIGIVEKMLQNYFNSLGFHIQYDGGTEFYKRDIIRLIVPYLEKTNIKFKVISKREIDVLVRSNRVRKILNKEKLNQLIQTLHLKRNKKHVVYIPRPDQTLIVNDAVKYFQTYDKGMLILICGVGKTLISLWITQQLEANTLVVGVPNKLLLEQWNIVIGKLFPEIPALVVSGGVSEDDILQFLEKYEERCIVITTYSSSHKVNTASDRSNFKFAMKILDEAHHLTSHNMRLASTSKTYIQMLNIPAVKQLALTATIKHLEGMGDDDNVISNDNVAHFGEIIDRKCLLWAINNNIVCDYVIQTIITNEEQFEQQIEQFNITDENDKRLFLSAYASLKSIHEGHSHHLLIYSNNKENSLKLILFVKLLLENNYFELPELYYSNYHSEMTSKDQTNIISMFENATQGIITCVYCLGEGWDFPLLDAVVFGENMTSNIRIVQSALRASRKNRNATNKKTKIILPILNRDDWLENNDNSDLKKVREVIYQMGLEDETIGHKIKVCRIEIKKQKPKPRPKLEYTSLEDFGEYDDELTQKLRLKTTIRTALGTTYEKTRKILVEKNIKSKEAYMDLCERDNRLTTEPEIVFKSQFTSWIEFLSIQRVYYELDTCKSKVVDYLTHHPAISNSYLDLAVVCSELCKLDPQFPPNGLWVDYYKIKDLRDIITIGPKKKKIISDIL